MTTNSNYPFPIGAYIKDRHGFFDARPRIIGVGVELSLVGGVHDVYIVRGPDGTAETFPTEYIHRNYVLAEEVSS